MITDRASGGEVVTFIGSDDYNLGAGHRAICLKKMNGEGNVIILEGVRGSVTSQERVRGFNKALEEFPKVKLLASQPRQLPACCRRCRSRRICCRRIRDRRRDGGQRRHGDGVIEALDGANRKALVVSINATKEGSSAVKAGKLLATGDLQRLPAGLPGHDGRSAAT